ncbi:MAG: hypothetical protein LIO91_11265 [Bacteroidales bacterium]|nr:hypothetical protein [Bacteroidales bacterium]
MKAIITLCLLARQLSAPLGPLCHPIKLFSALNSRLNIRNHTTLLLAADDCAAPVDYEVNHTTWVQTLFEIITIPAGGSGTRGILISRGKKVLK